MAAYDDYMSSLYKSIRAWRLKIPRRAPQSYYQKHPDVGLEPLAALDEAKDSFEIILLQPLCLCLCPSSSA